MNWEEIRAKVVQVVSALEPVINAAADVLAPELAAAISIGEKIIHGVINAEPTAIALLEQIRSGGTPSPEELQKFADDYEASYQKLKQRISEKLASTQ